MPPWYDGDLLKQSDDQDLLGVSARAIRQFKAATAVADAPAEEPAPPSVDLGGLVNSLTSAWADPSAPAVTATASTPEATPAGPTSRAAVSTGFDLGGLVSSLTSAWADPAASRTSQTAPPSGVASAQSASGTPSAMPGGTSPGTQPVGPTSTGASAPTGEIDNSSRESFVRTAYPHMLEAAGGNKDAAEMMLAAAISENGSVGTGKPFWANNFFGLKGEGPAGSVKADTWEQEGGQRVNQPATFAAYNSPTEGFRGFFDFLERNPRYATAMTAYRQTGDAGQLFRDVNAAGYATDPTWADKVASIRASQVAPVTAGLASRAPAFSGSEADQRSGLTAGTGLDVQGIRAAYKDVPYVFGGAGGRTDQRLGAATDCSGFVSSVMRNVYGVDLAAHTDTSYNQLKGLGAPEVKQQDARLGDVVYYVGAGTGGTIAHHMGIYAGPGKVLDMASSGRSDGVAVRDIDHAGQFVILRDPRVNPEQPRTATSPPEIVPTGYAERSPTEKPTPRQVDAVIAATPNAGAPSPSAPAAPAPVSTAPPTPEAGASPWSPDAPAGAGAYSAPAGRAGGGGVQLALRDEQPSQDPGQTGGWPIPNQPAPERDPRHFYPEQNIVPLAEAMGGTTPSYPRPGDRNRPVAAGWGETDEVTGEPSGQSYTPPDPFWGQLPTNPGPGYETRSLPGTTDPAEYPWSSNPRENPDGSQPGVVNQQLSYRQPTSGPDTVPAAQPLPADTRWQDDQPREWRPEWGQPNYAPDDAGRSSANQQVIGSWPGDSGNALPDGPPMAGPPPLSPMTGTNSEGLPTYPGQAPWMPLGPKPDGWPSGAAPTTMYRQPLAANAGPDTTPDAPPTASYNDPTGTGTLSQPLPDQQPDNPDAGPREATPGSVGAGPVGPLYGPEPAPSAAPARYNPYGGTPDPTVEATRATSPAGSPADAAPNAPSSTMLPVWDESGQQIGWRQVSPTEDANTRRQARGNMQVQAPGDMGPRIAYPLEPVVANPGEPDYAPPRPTTPGPGGEPDYVPPPKTLGSLLPPMAGADQTSERMRQIEANAAAAQGIIDPVRAMKAPLDPTWRAQNPEMAQEYDDLQNQLGLVVSGQVGVGGEVQTAERAAEQGSTAARAVGEAAPAERGGVQMLGSGMVPETGGRPPSAAPELERLSPVGRSVMETYARETPARVAATTQRAVQVAADAVARKIPARGGLTADPYQLMAQIHQAVQRNLDDTKVVMTGLNPGALRVFLRGEGLTSKAESGDLALINAITQGQVNVAGGRAKIVGGKKITVPYTLEDAADFAQRESEQMRGVTGGTRFPDPATGSIDRGAPKVLYAYVSEGQPLVAPNRPTLGLIWDEGTPRVSSVNHPFGLFSRGQDIHANMAEGNKALVYGPDAIRGARHAPATMEGGRLVEAAPGGPTSGDLAFDWQRLGVDVGDGRKIADSPYLVGPEGESSHRASALVSGMTDGIQTAIARGKMTDPEQIAAVLMRGGSPQWKPGWGSVTNPTRTESLIIDPTLENVRAIYMTGTPKSLAMNLEGGGGGGVVGIRQPKGDRITELEMAQRVRSAIKAQTGRDVPILFTDISRSGPSAKDVKAGTASLEGWKPSLITDAQVLEGPPLEGGLAPGRARIVDQYTQAINPDTKAPYTNIGSGLIPGRATLANAAQGAVVGNVGASEQEREQGQPFDPTTHALATAGGAVLGIGAGRAASRATGMLPGSGAANVLTDAAREGGALVRGIRDLGAGAGRTIAEATPGIMHVGSGLVPEQSANPNIRNVARMMSGDYKPVGEARPLGERVAAALTDRYAIHANVAAEGRGRAVAAGAAAPVERLAERVRENPNSIAAQRTRETLAPALQSVGADDGWLAQVLVHAHNLDVAAGKAQDAYDAAITAGRSPAQATVVAQRVQSSRLFSGGMTESDIVQALSDAQTEMGPERSKTVLGAAQAFWDSGRANLQRKLDEGIIDQATFDTLTQKYPHYVRTDIADYAEKGPANPSPAGKALGIGNQGIKVLSIEGTGKDRVNPILSTIDAVYGTENAITRNKAARDLVAVRDADPTTAGLFREIAPDAQAYRGNAATMVPPDYTLRNGEQKLTQWEQGAARQFVIPSEYAQLLTPNPGALLGETAAPVRTFFGILKSMLTTHNPLFQMVVSPIRDIGDATVAMQTAAGAAARRPGASGIENTAREAGASVAALPEAVGRMLQAFPRAFEGITTNSYGPRLAELRRAGMSFEGRPSPEYRGRLPRWLVGPQDTRAAMEDLSRSGGVEIKSVPDALRVFRSFATLGAEKIGSRLEMVPRIAAANMEQARGGDALSQAIAGKDATIDFLRGGWLSKQMSVPVMFLNPTVQSAAQTQRLWRKSPAAYVAALATTVGIPTLLAEAWNRSDPQRAAAYDDRPDYLKNTGILVEAPGLPTGTGKAGEALPNVVYIPLGNHAYAARLAREALGLVGDNVGLQMPQGGPAADLTDPMHWAKLGADIINMFSPLKGGDATAVAGGLVPAGMRDVIELGLNRNLYTGSTIATDRTDENASTLSKGIASGANAVLGTEWRPSQVEHEVTGPLGYGGRLAAAASDVLTGRQRPEQHPIQDTPVVGGLARSVVRDSGGQQTQDARDAMLTPDMLDVLHQAGMRSDQLAPAASRYQGGPLTRDEQLAWQTELNDELPIALDRAQRSPRWRSPATMQQAIQDEVSKARETAARRARLPGAAEIQRRIRDEQAQKAR